MSECIWEFQCAPQGAKSKRLIYESVTRCVTRCYVTRGSFENLNTSKRIVWGEKYGRFVTINIAKYEHFTRKTIRIYPHFVCPLKYAAFSAVLSLFCHHCYYCCKMKLTVTVTATHWTRNFRYRTRQSLARYWNFSFFVSEFVQVNPANSLTECVNLYMKCTGKNITKSQDSQSFETVRALFVIFLFMSQLCPCVIWDCARFQPIRNA